MWLSRIIPKARSYRYFAMRYTADHEWINYDEKSLAGTIGITDYAQGQLGDIVHITLPGISEKFKQSEVMATIESVKVVGDIYAPLSGTVTEINNALAKAPEIVNESAEAKGWLIKIKIDNISEVSKLLDKTAYDKLVDEIMHKGH